MNITSLELDALFGGLRLFRIVQNDKKFGKPLSVPID